MAQSLVDRRYRYMQTQEDLDYSKGYTSYLANDVVPQNQLVLATDTRISTLGRMKTRRGCDFFSVPAGETINATQTSVTGAADQALGLTSWLGAKFTTSAGGRLTRVDLNIKNSASATGPVIVEIHADASGSPGTLLAQSSIPAATSTSSYAYLTVRFIEAPLLVISTAYWIVAYVQGDGTNTYAWSSTTNATTAKTSSNSGVSWSGSAFDLDYKTYLSTDGGVLGRYRAYKTDGTKVELIAYKEAAGTTAVAQVNDNTGALTTVKTGLSASATRYEFDMANNKVYYVNGQDSPREWDFTTDTAVAALVGSVASRIKWHKSRMFFVSASNPTEIFFSAIADPETYASTDFLYVPSPQSADPISAWAVLNDNLYLFTQATKWVLTGSDLSNMVLRKATAAKGTKSPDSVVVTRSHVYFASDDNAYEFNGSTDTPIFTEITSEYQGAANKTTMAGAIFNNRYYLWFTPSGGNINSRCWLYNLDYKSMESNDTGAYIGKAGTWNGISDSGQFIQASSLVGAIYFGELSSNSYNNLGKALSWEIRTKYDHFGIPATRKWVKRWYPRFAATSGNYPVFCQFDKDFANSPTTIFVYLRGNGYLLGSVTPTLGNFQLGASSLIAPRITIPGLSKYVQRRYLRVGVNLPVEFLGDTLFYFFRRPR